jgi:hypothetical protein
MRHYTILKPVLGEISGSYGDKYEDLFSSGMLRLVILYNFIDVPYALTASIITALMMEAESISETSVYLFEITRRCIPEDSHLHNCRCENLKSHKSEEITI